MIPLMKEKIKCVYTLRAPRTKLPGRTGRKNRRGERTGGEKGEREKAREGNKAEQSLLCSLRYCVV